METPQLPTKDQKVQQENFRTYREAQNWLRRNGYKFVGYPDDDRRMFFVEQWEKEGSVALTMDITPFWDKLPLKILETPYQVDIANK